MTRELMCCAVLLGAAMGLAACSSDAMMPDDVADKIEKKRLEQPGYGPLEAPPGLSDDLPSTSMTTQPLTRDNR